MPAQSHRTFTLQLRAHLTKAGHRRLDQVLAQCATLYNAALQERRDAWKMKRASVRYNDQQSQLTLVRQDDPDWASIHLAVSRGVLRRIDRAFQSFFTRIRKGHTPGFPRFRSRRRYKCIELAFTNPNMLSIADNGRKAHIAIKGLPTLTLRLKKPLPDRPVRSIRIIRRSKTVDVDLVYDQTREPTKLPDNPIGIDMGVNHRMTLSNGQIIEPRQLDRTRETKLRQAAARAKKGSKRRRKRVQALSRETRRNKVRNRNQCHRITTSLVKQHGLIAVEKLQITNMTKSAKGTVEEPGTRVAAKSGLNRSILEQSWGIILSQLAYKAEWAGTRLVRVNPRNTSRRCSSCQRLRTEPIEEYRVFRCGYCGLELDRDLNAARNILKLALDAQTQGGNAPAASQEARTAATAVR